jgi:aspartate carbamoyltransferase regulatory subunit
MEHHEIKNVAPEKPVKKNAKTRRKRLIELISNGTVIDHIDPDAVFKIVQILRIDKADDQVTVGNNLKSKYYGRKGIIKIENVFLSQDDVNKVSVISPHVTMNIIRNYEVVKKFKAKLPPKVEGIIACNNPNCVTNVEHIRTRFRVKKEEPLALFCEYCERTMHREDIEVRHVRR